MQNTFKTTLTSGDVVSLTIDFDMSALTREQLEKLALKPLTIEYQVSVRSMKLEDAKALNDTSIVVGAEVKKLTSSQARAELARITAIAKAHGIEL